MAFTYVIEHMEDDEETLHAIPEWVELEYRHMRTLAGPDANLHFTHLSAPSRKSLSNVFTRTNGWSQDEDADNDEGANAPSLEAGRATAHQVGVLDLMKSAEDGRVPLDKVCLLDPKAEEELCPDDGDGRFSWFLFGGILGDDPPRDRTSELRVLGFPTRHLGPIQMTTDTAVGVTKLVVQDKVRLSEIPYIDYPTIRFNANESVEMPFRYILHDGEPRLPPGMRELLQKDLDKSFDF